MYGGGAAAVAVGGYFAYETFLGDSGPDGPEGVARAYAKALIDGNEDEMENLVHSDAPNRVQLTQSDGTGSNDQFSVSISSAELLNEGEETATVEVTLAFRGEFQGETINEETTAEIELRTENGNWRIYSITNTSI